MGSSDSPAFDFVVGAIASVIRWIYGQLTYKPNQRLTAVFALYMINILLFAWFYLQVYEASASKEPQPFRFDADVVKSRNVEEHGAVEREAQELRDMLALFASAEEQVTGLKTVVPKQYVGNYYDSVDFESGNYTCEIDLGPGFVDPYTNHLTRIMFLIVYRNQGRRIYGNEFRLRGPMDAKPPTREVADWDGRVMSGTNPALYSDVLALARQDVTTRLAPLESSSRATDPSVMTNRPQHWGYWDFVYFSAMTQATVGYGDIVPNSSLTRSLVTAQVLAGLALVGFGLTFVIRRRSNEKGDTVNTV
jgi:hypothetical protein